MKDDLQSKHAEINKRLVGVEEQLRNADQSASSTSSLERKKLSHKRFIGEIYIANFVSVCLNTH